MLPAFEAYLRATAQEMEQAIAADLVGASSSTSYREPIDCSPDPPHCHDRSKPRATVQQYTSLIGVDVAVNLEGVARARLEKRPRQYQSDAEVHQAYIQVTTSGGGVQDGQDDGEGDPTIDGVAPAKTYFEPLPWGITSKEDMRKILDFGHRVRLTPLVRELLALPCMKLNPLESVDAEVWHGVGFWQVYANIS